MLLNGKKNYLKTEEVQGGEIVTFLSEGEWIQSKNYKYEDETPRQDFYIKVKILDVEKDMRLNVTNRGILIEAFGKETQGWIGKQASLSKMKVLVGGKKMDTIEVTPITEEEPAL